MSPQPETPDEMVRRVHENFARQQIMATLGAELVHVAAGEADIAMRFNPAFGQQDGFLHAAAVSAIADSACGYAAFTLMPPGAGVLSIEFKVNLLSPAVGERFVAKGRVVRNGRTIKVARADVFASGGAREGERMVATLTATLTQVERPTAG